jgi:hypothetical protein
MVAEEVGVTDGSSVALAVGVGTGFSGWKGDALGESVNSGLGVGEEWAGEEGPTCLHDANKTRKQLPAIRKFIIRGNPEVVFFIRFHATGAF